MNVAQYDLARHQLSEFREAIVQAKRPEYTEGNEDVLNNFKVIARELGLSPFEVWYVYFRKHIASIQQFCKNPDMKTSEPIAGRVADAMNYLELFFALAREHVESR